MPKSIKIVLISTGYLILGSIYMFVYSYKTCAFSSGGISTFDGLVTVASVVYIFLGTLKKYRNAWFFGRFLGVIGIVFMIPIIVMKFPNELLQSWELMFMSSFIIPPLVISYSIGSPSALRYFDLICPSCQSKSPSILMSSKAKCRKCGHIW